MEAVDAKSLSNEPSIVKKEGRGGKMGKLKIRLLPHMW